MCNSFTLHAFLMHMFSSHCLNSDVCSRTACYLGIAANQKLNKITVYTMNVMLSSCHVFPMLCNFFWPFEIFRLFFSDFWLQIQIQNLSREDFFQSTSMAFDILRGSPCYIYVIIMDSYDVSSDPPPPIQIIESRLASLAMALQLVQWNLFYPAHN